MQPFVVVELEFVPDGRTDPVVAVDMIDDGSLRAIERGVDVPIHYSAADPRWAQIDNATRTYYWKNLRTFGIIGLDRVCPAALRLAPAPREVESRGAG